MRRELLSPNWRGLERRSAVRSGYWWRTESAGNKGESSQLDGTIVDIMWSVLPTLFQMRALVRHRYCPHSEPLQWPKLPRFWFFKGLVWPRHLSNSIYTLEHRRALAEDVLFLHFLFPTRRQNRRRRNPLPPSRALLLRQLRALHLLRLFHLRHLPPFDLLSLFLRWMLVEPSPVWCNPPYLFLDLASR